MSEKNNKKKIAVIAVLVIVIIAAVIAIVAGINKRKSGTDATETENASATQRSGQFDIDYEKQVTKLADYSAIPITVDSDYEVTDESKQSYLTSVLTSFGGDPYKQVTDRDTVEEGDYVKVDYTGYKDGEAFDGGSASDQLLDVSNNCSVSGTSFIDGFTAPIIGAKVGDTVKGDVTFPEDYGNDDLNGQTVTFEYTIKGIYSADPVALADLTDEQVNTVFGTSAGITTVDDLNTQIESDLKQQLYSAEVTQIKNYMVENSTVDIPEEYLQARLNEYITSFTDENVSDGQTLEDYLSTNYSITVDQATETWTSNLTTQIKVEFIFGLIAQKEGIEMDEDAFDNYVSYIISASNGQFSEADDVYEYFGSGHKDEGETYLKNQYLVNKAIDLVTGNAQVTFRDSSASESTDTSETTETAESAENAQ